MGKMISLTRSPRITFHTVPYDNVSTGRDYKLICDNLGRQLEVEELKYQNRALSAVVVNLMGRGITVSLGGTGCAYDLCFDQIEVQTEQPYSSLELFNRVR